MSTETATKIFHNIHVIPSGDNFRVTCSCGWAAEDYYPYFTGAAIGHDHFRETFDTARSQVNRRSVFNGFNFTSIY